MLTMLYEASLKQQSVPDDWKSFSGADFKTWSMVKSCQADFSHLHPCKILEHIMHSHIFKHLEAHNILSKDQHGFRKFHSCESQLLTTLHDFAAHLDSGSQIDAILLDFTKAFDKVTHQWLLSKLSHYGIQGALLNWIKSFLTNRSQRVVLNNSSEPTMYNQEYPKALGPCFPAIYQ